MEKNKLGVVMFLLNESVFFSLLIIAYAYFHASRNIQGPTAATSLNPVFTGIFSLFLLASSGTMWLAGRSLHSASNAGRPGYRRAAFWLAVSIVLGIIFLVGQGIEWSRLIASGVRPSTNLFGTTFFTLTGFHGLHVIVGLIALAILCGINLRRKSPSTLTVPAPHAAASGAAGLEAIAVYWHFVDGVWIVIFGVVYASLLLR
jgi:heme/copper-type cytochrome/quinol oxidase subunit 3